MTTNPNSYTVGLLRDFVAQHHLIGGDWGRENQPHSHHYRWESVFEGDALDRHGYLLDISLVEPRLDQLVERYRDSMLNDLPELSGQNPSLERFADLLADGLTRDLPLGNVQRVTVKLWENEHAFATCQRTVR